MACIFPRSLATAVNSAANWLTTALIYPLPEHHREEVAYQREQLAQDPTQLKQALSLLLIPCSLWWALLRSWSILLPERLNPQWVTAQISCMYGPNMVEQIEQAFLDDYFNLALRSMRLLGPCLIVLTAFSAVLDIWCLPETWPMAWAIRAAVCVVLGCTTLITFRFKETYKEFYQPIQAVSILAASVGLVTIMARSHTGEPGYSAYLASFMLLVLMTVTLSGLRTGGAWWTLLMMTAVYEISLSELTWLRDGLYQVQTMRQINDMTFIVEASLLAVAATFWQERSLRISFAIRYVLLHTYGQFIRAFGGADVARLQAKIAKLQHRPTELQSFLKNSYPLETPPFLLETSTVQPSELTPGSAFSGILLVANSNKRPSTIESQISQGVEQSEDFLVRRKNDDFLSIAKTYIVNYYDVLKKMLCADELHNSFGKLSAVRELFKQDYFYANFATIKACIYLAVASYMSFTGLDWLMLPETRQISLYMRGAFLPIGLVTIIATSSETFFSRAFQWFVGIAALYAGISIVVMIGAANPNELGYQTYYAGLINVLIFIFAFSRLRLPITLLISGTIVTSYIVAALRFQEIYALDRGGALFANSTIFLLGSCIVGAIALRIRESCACGEFFVRYLLLEKNKEILAFQEENNITPQQLWTLFTQLRHSPEKLKALLVTILQSSDCR